MSAKQNPLIKKVYIPLDCLLDTRLGTLIKIDPDYAFAISSKSNYYLRELDNFTDEEYGTVSKEDHNKIYIKYKDEIIRNSLLTKLFPFISELCTFFTQNSIATPYYGDIEIDINLYPFQFSPAEEKAILSAIVQKFNKLITVNLIHLSPDELTREYVADHYVALFMYEIKTWLDQYSNELQKKPLTNVTIYTPRLNHIREFTEDEKNLIKEKNMDLFLVLKQLLSVFINIEFLPIALFSADTIENKQEFYL